MNTARNFWMVAGVAVLGLMMATAPAAADRDRNESGKGRWSHRDRDDRHDVRGREVRHGRDDDRGRYSRDRHRPTPVIVAPSCPPPARSGLSILFGVGQRCETVTTQEWVPGHYETVSERVLVEPGRFERRFLPAETRVRYGPCGERYVVVVRPARWEEVWIEPRYEEVCRQVWVEGHYVERTAEVCEDRPTLRIGARVNF